MSRPAATVVIPYYNNPAQLGLLLTALSRQTVVDSFEVVIADDGSAQPPIIPDHLGLVCSTVRQDDLGFRAAAARNLGAAQARGELLLFLDQDVLPTSTYVQRMVDAACDTDDGHGLLVVGRRRHFRRSGQSDSAVLALLDRVDPAVGVGAASGGPMPIDDDPTWLRDGYRRTQDLRIAGDEDYRLVISAVLGVDRRAWLATGGFDETFVGYGGEDWDLGWRAWLSGAVLRHVPEAIGWHDGPEPGRRAIPLPDRNSETIRLAAAVPLTSARGTGLIHAIPATTVRYQGVVTGDARDAPVIACVAGLLDRADAAVWFPALPSRVGLPPLLRDDPRVRAGEVPDRVLARTIHVVDVYRPVGLPEPLGAYCAVGDRLVPGWLQIRHTRSVNRGISPIELNPAQAGLGEFDAQLSLERRWGRW